MSEISSPGGSHESLICFQIKHLNPKYTRFRSEMYRVQSLFFPLLTSHITREILLNIKHKVQFKLVCSVSGPVEVKSSKIILPLSEKLFYLFHLYFLRQRVAVGGGQREGKANS